MYIVTYKDQYHAHDPYENGSYAVAYDSYKVFKTEKELKYFLLQIAEKHYETKSYKEVKVYQIGQELQWQTSVDVQLAARPQSSN